MKIKRKEQEQKKEKKGLANKIGIASSSAVGAGIGAVGGYALSEKGKDEVFNKNYNKNLNDRLEQIKKSIGLAQELTDKDSISQVEQLKKMYEKEAISKSKEAGKNAVLKHRSKFILPATVIGATAGGIAYDKITKKKRRSRDNENTETK